MTEEDEKIAFEECYTLEKLRRDADDNERNIKKLEESIQLFQDSLNRAQNRKCSPQDIFNLLLKVAFLMLCVAFLVQFSRKYM